MSEATTPQPTKQAPKGRYRAPLPLVGLLLGAVVVLYALFAGYAYLSSPAAIRNPKFQHYHFRTQVIVNGKPVDFAEQKYQMDVTKDICNAELTKQPFHFHDNKDQMAHIHWDGVTGGMLLKYYGWDMIGGVHNTLGYRFDNLPKVTSVPVHGNVLPEPPKNTNYYVFIGDEHGYKEKNFDDFLHQDLEQFFGKKSNLPENTTTWLGKLFPKAAAHGTEDHGDSVILDQAKLEKVNNLLGNVVIFAQEDKPSPKDVKARFDKLEPLSASSCAG